MCYVRLVFIARRHHERSFQFKKKTNSERWLLTSVTPWKLLQSVGNLFAVSVSSASNAVSLVLGTTEAWSHSQFLAHQYKNNLNRMITPASPANAIVITKLSWPDMKENFILITYIFSYMKYPEPGCFSQQLWLIGTHIKPSTLYEHKSQSRWPGPKTKRRRNESSHRQHFDRAPCASMHSASLNATKRSEVNQLQLGTHIENFLIGVVFPNEKKQERLQTSRVFPSDNFNFSEIVSHLTLGWIVFSLDH